MARNLLAEVVVIGFHGRKGPKADPTLMGSAVSHLGLNTDCPVIIVKDKKLRSDKPHQSFRWAVCNDGSAQSIQLFEQLSHLMDL